MVGAILFAPPVSAQSNPFIPASPVSKADVQRMLDERLASIRDEMAKNKADAAPTAPGMPGAPGAPGMPSGAAVPGGMTPPGAPGIPGGSPMGPGIPGAPGVPGDYSIEPPKGAVEAALSNGARFLGCINGQQKFVKRSGERVAFTAKEIREAVSSGVAPACR
jgi:hypothetical protein